MSIRRCPCSFPPRQPLCAICLALKDLAPLIRTELSRGRWFSAADREDLVQQVLLELIRAGCEAHEFRGLVVTIARRRRVDAIRRRVRHRPWSVLRVELPAPPQADDLGRDLEEAMALMADDTRLVFEAVFLSELPLRQAARTLGLTLHEVRMLYEEAMQFLRQLWGASRPSENTPAARTNRRGERFHSRNGLNALANPT